MKIQFFGGVLDGNSVAVVTDIETFTYTNGDAGRRFDNLYTRRRISGQPDTLAGGYSAFDFVVRRRAAAVEAQEAARS